MRKITIWNSGRCRYFSPVGATKGEEIFAAPIDASEEQIHRAWREYEHGQLDWMDLADMSYWD